MSRNPVAWLACADGQAMRFPRLETDMVNEVRIYVRDKIVKVEKKQFKRWQRKYHRFYYIKERGIYVPVSEEFYKDIMRPQWSEEKAEQRNKECIYKGTKQCDGYCDSCTHHVYQEYSLNHMEENGSSNIPFSKDEAEEYIMGVAVSELHEAVNQLDKEDYELLGVLIGDETERAAADRTGRSKTGVHKSKERILKFLKKKLLEG